VPGRALVLGAGGVTGVAWEVGVLAGLAEAGVDLRTADLVVGTSAGSAVGVTVASGGDLEQAFARQLEPNVSEIAARMNPGAMLRWGWALLRPRKDPAAARAQIGRMALAARTIPEADRRAVIEARLPVHTWPRRRLLVTAVDAESGEFAVFDADSGVGLVDAVAASCAVPGVWPPVTINGRRWIDGGVRSPANADLATGCEQVVVIAPLVAGAGPMPSVASQVAELARTARVVTVTPDEAAKRAIGRNVLDPARRAPAAQAGRAQAAGVAAAVGSVWAT
jgi:NTE family protein